jgi:hypothetical protein
MDTTQKLAIGTVEGRHNFLQKQPVPALETWVFVDRESSEPMPKGSVAFICGQNGLSLIEVIEDGCMKGPINYAAVERSVWDEAVSTRQHKRRNKLRWMGGVAAVSLLGLALVFATIPPGGMALLALCLVGLTYSVAYAPLFWMEGQIETADTTRVPLPKRKQDHETTRTGDDGSLAALYVVAHKGHLDIDAIDGGSSSDNGGGHSDGGGDGGGSD